MNFVDTHCHIQSAGLDHGERSTHELWAKSENMTVDAIVHRAKQVGVTQLICVGCDLEDSKLAIKCVKIRENLYASIGIHPHEAQHFAGKSALLDDFTKLAEQPKVVAVGECGLDYYYTHSPKEAQADILRFQLNLARTHDLPLIFHVREAFDDFWPIFDEFKGIRGVLHSFTDSVANMQEAVKRGLFIGVNGIATFAKSEQQLAMYRSIPLSSLLLETDAPFLTPAPFRGKICESKHLVLTAGFLSELRDENLIDIAAVTTHNAHNLFNF